MVNLGVLDALWRYPVKSLAGEPLDSVRIDEDGIPGDRAAQLVVRDGHARVGKAYRGKENNRLHLTHETSDAVRAANDRGVSVDVESGAEHYFDARPISLILDIWLAGLAEHVGFAIDHERFRPNLFVKTAAGTQMLETDLVNRELQLGEARLRVLEPIGRCVTTTYDVRTGESEPEILRYVAQQRANVMGVYCDVLRAGIVRIGDSLELLAR